MISEFKTAIAAATLGLMVALPSSAATISWGDASSPAPNPAPTSTTPTVLIDQTLSVPGLTKSPFEGTGLYGTVFNSVGLNASATYLFSSVQSTLTFIWGSVDDYNFLDFYKADAFVETFSGIDAGPIFTTNRPITEMLASIVVTGGFDKVVFRSVGENAFEHASVAAVPVPAAGFLLIGALGGLAALRRRKTA